MLMLQPDLLEAGSGVSDPGYSSDGKYFGAGTRGFCDFALDAGARKDFNPHEPNPLDHPS